MKTLEVGTQNGYYGVYQYTPKGNQYFIPLGRDINIEEILRNIETDEYFLKLGYQYNNDKHTYVLPRSDLTEKKILKASAFGMDVFDRSAEALVELLRIREGIFLQSNSIQNMHKTLGFVDITMEGQHTREFLHYRCKSINSTYNGILDIKPKGKFSDWCDDMRRLILGNIPMETVVVCGLSAVTFGYLKGSLDFTNPIIHICGDSTSGKSTALEVAIATAGNPSLQANGLAKSWRGTSNALISALLGIQGLPVGRDELSLYKGKDLSELVYQISLGREKERLDKDCRLKATESFTTVLISTGETDMLSHLSGNTGLNLRVLDLKAESWTTSASNAEEIKKASEAHYGTACVAFAKALKEYTEEEVLDMVEEYRTMYMQRTKMTKFVERTSVIYAVILLTASIMHHNLGVEFHKEEILDFLLKNEESVAVDFDRDLGNRFYVKFREYILINKNNFIEKSSYHRTKVLTREADSPLLKKWGTIRECSGLNEVRCGKKVRYEVAVRKNRFKAIVTELGFEDSNNILRSLKEKGLLNCDGDRYTRGRKIDTDITEEVYVFYLTSEDDSKDDTEERLKTIAKEENDRERQLRNQKKKLLT